MKVRNKVLLVSGGGNGMGREVLEALRRGAQIAAADIRQDGLESTPRWQTQGINSPRTPST